MEIAITFRLGFMIKMLSLIYIMFDVEKVSSTTALQHIRTHCYGRFCEKRQLALLGNFFTATVVTLLV